MSEPDATPEPAPEDDDEEPTPPFASYLLLYTGLFVLVIGVGLLMVLFLRLSR